MSNKSFIRMAGVFSDIDGAAGKTKIDILINFNFQKKNIIHNCANLGSSAQTSEQQQRPTSVNYNAAEFKDKVETRLISLWNNMKYGWNTKLRSNFNKESAIWVLGRCYHQKVTPNPSMQSSAYEPSYGTPLHEELPVSCNTYSQRYAGTDTRNDNSSNTNKTVETTVEAPEETGQDIVGEYEEGFDGFKKDFISKIWMTYRRDFEIMHTDLKSELTSIPINGFTSDCGWGCMIRSAQMLLSNALIIHFLGRCWRYDPHTQITTTEDNIHRKIIRWFGDQESKSCPFSIHKIVKLGKKSGKKVGEWYGPQEIAHILKEAVKEAAVENIDLASLHIYVAQDCTIYNQDIIDECYSQEILTTAPWQNKSTRRKNVITWKHLILLIPLKVGQGKFINKIYAECLKAMLSLEWCIGIIGGKTNHSLYFIGYQDEKLIHLDPHYCQDFVDMNIDQFPLTSFHCKTARKMKISKMDPSCCLGFYIPTKTEYDRFQESVQHYLQPVFNYAERQKSQSARSCLKPQNVLYDQSTYPMFIFHSGRLRDAVMHTAQPKTPSSLKELYLEDDDTEDDGIEDFVIL